MSQTAIAKNIAFFFDNRQAYAKNVDVLDTYSTIKTEVSLAVLGSRQLLDVGNGLIFNYDVTKVRHVVALDLFLNPKGTSTYPANVEFKKGSALNIPEPDESFDTVLMDMLLHHLVDKSVDGSSKNVQRAINEAFRVLKPGGKLIISESVVPGWFFALEKLVFPATSFLVDRFLTHPMAFQYPIKFLIESLSPYDRKVRVKKIPKGRWILQFGFKYPTALTPINLFILIAQKPLKGKSS